MTLTDVKLPNNTKGNNIYTAVFRPFAFYEERGKKLQNVGNMIYSSNTM